MNNIKRILTSLVIAIAMTGCSEYDDTAIWDSIEDIEGRLAQLEELCDKMNTNLFSLQAIVEAMEERDYITSVESLPSGEGYVISFESGKEITIYHGKDGTDGVNGIDAIMPKFKIEDGYWFISYDDGANWEKLGQATGADGQDGKDGADGADGFDGLDGVNGITPLFKIEDGYWFISYDEGASWEKLGQATGADGVDGSDGADGQDGEDGTDGQDGQDGEDGTDGQDGQDGVTPIFKIEEGFWFVSYDNGASWEKLGKATGADGEDGQDGKDGVDGEDGYVPEISVRQDVDGEWYWTVDGEWLIVDGHKVKAVGTDGKDGADGADGQDGEDGEDGKDGVDGADGQDGITPQFKIEDGYWFVSYDNGISWENLGKATGEDGLDGKDGDSIFREVTQDDENVYFILADGTTITIAKSKGQPALYLQINTDGILKMSAGQTVSLEYEIFADDDANVSFDTFEQYGWIVVVNPNAGNENTGTISITAPSPIRDGKIMFILSDDKGNFYVQVVEIQGEGNIIEIVKDSYIIDETGGMLDVAVNSNIEFTVSIPDESKAWIETVSVGKTTRFSIAANEGYDERTAEITFVGNDGDTKKEISITQLQKDAILLTNSTLDVSDAEQIVNIVFTSNVNVSVNIPEDVTWITYAATKAMSERAVELFVMANDSPEKRTAVVTLTDENNSISETVTINQEGYVADYLVFEDQLLKEALVELYDSNDDGEIDSREAAVITDLVCSGKSIYSLKGIEKLVNLKTLDCSNNSIVELDLTANSGLTSLKCNSNSLVSLDISGLENLSHLNCSSNSLTQINTETNTGLTYIDCSSNNIKTLDVSKNIKLDKLYCHSCRLLQTLNIENLSLLTALYLNTASSNCIAQRTVSITGSSLQSLIMGGSAKWTNVVISDNPNLMSLDLNGLATMTDLTCTSNPQLAKMSVGNCYALKELECTANILISLDLSTNRALINLNCSGNRLQTLDLSNNVALLSLDCNNNNLSSLSVNNSLSIDHIDCSANVLSALDVTSLGELNNLDCYDNELKSLNLSSNVKLTALDCSENPLTGLDLSKNIAIESVNSSTTDITTLDLTANTSLSEILCKDCYNLAGVVFPETLVAIQQEAFMNCTSLISLTLPASITSIGKDAFRNCSKLAELNINSDIVGSSFYGYSFTGSPITTVNMNETVTEIGPYAFYGTSISSILIPANVIAIGSFAFSGNLTLTSVSFAPNSKLQTIDNSFNSCKNLKYFDASNCNNIKSIIAELITSDAFKDCIITDFKVGTATPPSYRRSSLNPSITNLYVPKGSVDAYKASMWGDISTNILELE